MPTPRDYKEFKRLVEGGFDSFSRSQKIIARYLLDEVDHVAFLNAAELAAATGVSEATVVRFARALGFGGFPRLRRFLLDAFRQRISPAVRMRNKLVDLKRSGEHVLTQVVGLEAHYLERILESVALDDFDEAVRMILKGKRLFVFGIGPSRILTELVVIRLQRFGIMCVGLMEAGRDLMEKLVLLDRQDVVLATAFHKVTGELTAVLRHARSVGCATVLLTDILDAEMKHPADLVLTARRGPIYSFHSLTVPMAILNAMILAVALARPQRSLGSLKRLDTFRKEYGLDPIGELP